MNGFKISMKKLNLVPKIVRFKLGSGLGTRQIFVASSTHLLFDARIMALSKRMCLASTCLIVGGTGKTSSADFEARGRSDETETQPLT
jgi:hypothetical protein